MRRLQAIILAAVLLPPAVSLCAPLGAEEAAALDLKVQFPADARPREAYVRFFVADRVKTLDDLPFTSLDDFSLPAGDVVLGLFVLPGEFGVAGPPGVRVLDTVAELPYAVHGGCRAVNVVMDPKSGRTLGSWCNVDDQARPPPHPEAEPPGPGPT